MSNTIDVSGLVFKTGDDLYISFPLVNRAVNRGQPKQQFCTEMLHWDEYRQAKGIADGVPPMQKTFSSSYSEIETTTFTMDSEIVTSEAVWISPFTFDSPSQPYCSEMEHWDDLQEMRGTKGDCVTMQSLFKPFFSKRFTVYDINEQRLAYYISNSIALLRFGSPDQRFCAEMDHYDNYIRMKTGQLNQPSISSLFQGLLPR